MYIVKHILLVIALITFDVGFSVLIATGVKHLAPDLPSYAYNLIGGTIGIIGMLIYLPLFFKIEETKLNG